MRYFCLIILFGILLGISIPALAIKYCDYCNYRLSSDAIICPKCLRNIAWALAPARSEQATVIVRSGKDAFIRHPFAQNRNWHADRNAGKDPYGAIGSWGYPTSLRYLIAFDVPNAFLMAGVDINNFQPDKVTLLIRVKANQPTQRIPIIVYPLKAPFMEGTCQLGLRFSPASGVTWFNRTQSMPWASEGGDYNPSVSAEAYLESSKIKNLEQTIKIDVTDIYLKRFQDFKNSGIWDDPGMIIMRNPGIAGNFRFLDILSFESGKNKNVSRVVSPELYFQ